ncbi:MAG: pitrilysin family protein [Flavobacteriales bacterium]|nr:pitrilysin family protein [Flavobacteriales bacterium]
MPRSISYDALSLVIFSFSLCIDLSGQTRASTAEKNDRTAEVLSNHTTTDILSNGLQVIIIEDSSEHQMTLAWGAHHIPSKESDRVGIAALTGELLRMGSGHLMGDSLDAKLEELGAAISTQAGRIWATSPDSSSYKTLAIFADILMQPVFSEESLTEARNQHLAALKEMDSNPKGIANKVGRRVLFGPNHPYGELETDESLMLILRDDLVRYHETHYRPNMSSLVIYSGLSADDLLPWIDELLGHWNGLEIGRPHNRKPTIPMSNRVCFVDNPEALESVIHLSHVANVKPNSPDRTAIDVLNVLLGQAGFNHLLQKNLMKEQGQDVDVRCQFNFDPFMGSFVVEMTAKNQVTARTIATALNVLNETVQNQFDDDLVNEAILHAQNVFMDSFADSNSTALMSLEWINNGFEVPFYRNYLSALEQVKASDVKRVAIRYLRPKNLFITVVGNQQAISESLVSFSGKGELDYYDTRGNILRELDPVPEGETSQSVIERFYEACGGISKFEGLKSLRRRGIMNPEQESGLRVELVDIFGFGHAMRMFNEEQIMMEQVFTADRSFIRQMGQVREMNENRHEREKSKLFAAPLLHLSELGREVTLVGVDARVSPPCYVVEVRKDDNLLETLFFNQENHLLERATINQFGPTGTVEIAEEYASYAWSKGMMYPMIISQMVHGQGMVLELEEVTPNGRVDQSIFQID